MIKDSARIEPITKITPPTELPTAAAMSMLNLANALLMHNINERENIDRTLQNNEQRFRLLAENATDMISQQTPSHVYIYTSPSCKTLLGYTPEEMMGKPNTHFIHEADLEKVKKHRNSITKENNNYTLTYRMRRKDGNYVWFETTTRLIRDPKHHEIVEIHEASRNITTRINEERARLRSQKLAQVSRLRTMEEMASGMAHEINQPLAAVVNYTQGCLRHLENLDHEKNKKLLEIMEKASEQAKRAGEIIHRLKNFFAKGKLYKAPEKVSRLIREAINFIKDDIEKNKTKIRFKFGKNLPLAFVDKIQIQQVVLNLIQNALEAMQDTPHEQRKITIKTELAANKKIDVTFSDSGPGFSKELVDKIFQPFFTTKPKGTGMGLPISRSIIEAHGGKFSIKHKENKQDGYVQFTLPIVEKKRR